MCICVFDYLSRFVYGSLFLAVRHFFVCLSIFSVSLIFYSAFLSVCLFVSVLLSDVYLTVYICQCFSSFVILSVCLFLCVRHFVCLTSFHLSVFFPFVTLTVCVCFSGARHVLCMTARPSISVSFHFSLCLSVCLFPLSVILCVWQSVYLSVFLFCLCFSGWLHVCLPPNYKIDLLIDDNHFHSVTYILLYVSYKLFRIQSVNLSVILWSLLNCLFQFVRVIPSPMSRFRYILMVVWQLHFPPFVCLCVCLSVSLSVILSVII